MKSITVKAVLGGILVPLALLAFSSGKPDSVPEHFENKAYDVTKIPIPDEPELNLANATSEWEALGVVEPPSCETQSVWKLVGKPDVSGTAIKEKLAPVQGRFTRVQAHLLGEPKGPVTKGMGYLDLSSWDSGNLPRDRRVARYVFGVEEKGVSALPFTFTLGEWKDKGSWETTLKLQFEMLGKAQSLDLPVKVDRKGDTVSIITTTPEKGRFTYATPEYTERIMQLLDRCNHQFLASYADVTLHLTFKKSC